LVGRSVGKVHDVWPKSELLIENRAAVVSLGVSRRANATQGETILEQPISYVSSVELLQLSRENGAELEEIAQEDGSFPRLRNGQQYLGGVCCTDLIDEHNIERARLGDSGVNPGSGERSCEQPGSTDDLGLSAASTLIDLVEQAFVGLREKALVTLVGSCLFLEPLAFGVLAGSTGPLGFGDEMPLGLGRTGSLRREEFVLCMSNS
jgi:hypothetical protein